MKLTDAIKNALNIDGVIYRSDPNEMWESEDFHMRAEPNGETIYLQTIARPDLCPTHVKTPYFRVGGWYPSVLDILADDWEVESMEQFKSRATPEYLDLFRKQTQES